MKPDDPKIKWIEEPQLGLAGRMYWPLVAQGLTTTFKHISRSLRGDVVTVPGFMNKMFAASVRVTPRPVIRRVVHRMQDAK